MAVTSIRYSTAPARKKPKAGDERYLKGRGVWQVRQQKIVNDPVYGYCRLVNSHGPVFEWVDAREAPREETPGSRPRQGTGGRRMSGSG